MPFNQSMVSPVIIGRDDHVQSLEHLVEQTASGNRQTVLLTGEAGVGKTRLVAETESMARRRGLLVMQGNCFESDQSFPYAPFIDLLRRFVDQLLAEDLVGYFGAEDSEIAKLLPDLAPLLPDVTPSTALVSGQEKRRLFQSLVHFIARLTAAQPLLLILEDLHWSDDSSLEFLLYLIRHTAEHPILLVLTCRSDETNPGLRHLLAELDRERLAIELPVAPLSLAQVDALLCAVFRLDQPVRPEFRDELYALTEGNPFFIEEVCKSLVASGEIFYSGGAWDSRPLEELHIPRTIQDAVQRRLDQLGDSARHVATWGAVVGARFGFALLQELAEMNEVELLQQIKELISAQLVVEESAEQFAFRHALTREAVYATLLLRERKSLHRFVADALERHVPSAANAPTADLAYHYYAAEAWGKAYQYSRRAGEEAVALYAPREAIQDFTRALDAAAHLAAEAPDPSIGGKSGLGTLYRQRGQAYEITGDFEGAEADYERALSAARDAAQLSSAGLPPNSIQDIRASEAQDRTTEWQCLIDLGFLWAARDYERTGDYFRRALELAELSGDLKLRAHSLNRYGNWLVNTGQATEGLNLHREALEVFESQGDQVGIAETVDLLVIGQSLYGDIVNAMEEANRAIELFRKMDDKRGLVSTLVALNANIGCTETTFVPARTIEDCQRDGTEAADLARKLGWPAGEAMAEWTTGLALGTLGLFGAGLQHAQNALRIAREIEHGQWIIAGYYTSGYIHTLLLQPDLALADLETALPLAGDLSSAWWVNSITAYLALSKILKGDLSSAEAVLKARMSDDQTPRNLSERRVVWAWGHLALAEGQPDRALRITKQLQESAPGADRRQSIPELLKLEGEALMALDRWDEARQALEQARMGAQLMGERPRLWQIQNSLGQVYRRLGRHAEARKEWSGARQVIASLAESIDDSVLRGRYMDSALTLLPRAKSASSTRLDKQEFGGLTEREVQVAGLIAQGKSNREIAEALVVSERTVTTHVTHILSKLGFGSRAQIAAWTSEKGNLMRSPPSTG